MVAMFCDFIQNGPYPTYNVLRTCQECCSIPLKEAFFDSRLKIFNLPQANGMGSRLQIYST